MDRISDVVTGSVKFLAGIFPGLANFPHQKLYHGLPMISHLREELFDVFDSVGY